MFLLSIFSRSSDSRIDQNEVGGVGAIGAALAARRSDDYTPDIYFDEPRLVDRGAGPVNDLYVVIPTSTEPGEQDPANIEFELPKDPDDENAELNRFLDDMDAASIDEVEGMSVPSYRASDVLKPVRNAGEVAE